VVEGYDVVRQAAAVRELIGLAGQSAAIQDDLTGRENLEIIGRLYHLGKQRSRERAAELLERFDLADASDRAAKTYSGGMQRRLDLAASLVAEPAVLFLDEPTTGLDPRSRIGMWSVIRDLVRSGTTLLLTTQYLEEADELADDIVVIDHGEVIAQGTAEQLKDRVGGDVVELTVPDLGRLGEAAEVVAGISAGPPQVERGTGQVTLRIGSLGSQALVQVVRRLDQAGIEVEGLGLRRPSLDDVFLALTGHVTDGTAEGDEPSGRGGRRARRGRTRDGQEAEATATAGSSR
jgi:ABC-2 type transport system ATP-binding protein